MIDMKRKMEKIWLEKVIVDLFSSADSCLKSSFDYLVDLVNKNKCELFLFDPDLTACQCFYILNGHAFVLPNNIKTADIIRTVLEQKKAELIGSDFYIPLWYDGVSAFGILHFDHVFAVPEAAPLEQAVKAFSAVLYSEAMGSIFNSVHSPVLVAEDLCVDYVTKHRVSHIVKNLNIMINEKEFSIIYGSSGCGKTTLINALGGMLKPASGSILWKGKSIVGMSDKELTKYRRNNIGFIFQKYNLINDLTAEENIRIVAALVNDPLSCSEVLDMVGLANKAQKYPPQLSGGEQQRVCIARALVKRAEMIICDEPTGALDTENALQVVRILQRLTKEQGTSVLMITHNQNFFALADHSFVMKDGQIVDEFLQPFAVSAYDLKTC